MLHPVARWFRRPRRAGCNPCERADERTAAGPWSSILERSEEICITLSDDSHSLRPARRAQVLLLAVMLLGRRPVPSAARRCVVLPGRLGGSRFPLAGMFHA